ncbi:MAG: alpha/beta hydrolase, partial [Pseudomonadota bacterium]
MDWESAYDNSAAVANSDRFFPQWEIDAKAFRDAWVDADAAELDVAYGDHPRQKLDIFYPRGSEPTGLLVHVHGGYWMRTDKSVWSHFAEGALQNGLAVAMPSYRLCPEVSIASITSDVSSAIAVAAKAVSGSIVLTGHSAGGHLVSRQVCRNAQLTPELSARIK